MPVRLTTPEEIFSFKLGAALTMETTILGMLDDLEQNAQREELRELFSEHAAETKQHVANIEKSFELLGEKVEPSPCPTIEGLKEEGTTTIAMTDNSIVDAVLLAGAGETEHHEIAVYETLVTNAEARGASDVAELLKQNLQQEQAALEKVKTMGTKISTEGIAVAV